MDVLENPFVRLKYFFRAGPLCQQLFSYGFSLYAAWPYYSDCLSVYWHKKEQPAELNLSNNFDFISRSVFSFAFGRKMFLCSQEKEKVARANEMLAELLVLIDCLLDDFDSKAIKKCDGYLAEIKDFLSKENILAGSDIDLTETLHLIESIRRILELLQDNAVEALIQFCNSDSSFIQSWGQPAHFAVFQKKGNQGST